MRVIYIDFNDCSGKYPNSINDGDAFFTHGFGGLFAREFKKYNQDFDVECWKADSRIKIKYCKTISGVKFCVFPAINFYKLGFLSFALAKEIKKIQPGETLINVSTGRHLLFLQIAPLCRRIALVVQHHGETTSIFDIKNRKGFLSKLRALFTLIPENLAFGFVNHYFVLDNRVTDYFPSSFKGTYSVQTTGVDPDLFKPINKNEARRMLGLAEDKMYILYIGRIGDHKRFDLLLDVFRELKQERNDIQLLVAGNRPGDQYEKEAREMEGIIYGVISQTEIYKYLSAADVYVLPGLKSIHTFGGVGMLPLQAGLCKTPAVGATLESVKQDKDYQIGIYANGKEAIKEGIIDVLKGSFPVNHLRENIIERFSWEQISVNTRSVYLKILLKRL
ncbi:MAG: glycosyltransferase family 4 protein [Saprospiraceae bacterium]|nr:glycosyltransferase family 4 protein [Saprospiraceae bacterium]